MDLGKSINIALEGAAIFKVFSFYECSDPGKQCCYIFKTYWRKDLHRSTKYRIHLQEQCRYAQIGRASHRAAAW